VANRPNDVVPHWLRLELVVMALRRQCILSMGNLDGLLSDETSSVYVILSTPRILIQWPLLPLPHAILDSGENTFISLLSTLVCPFVVTLEMGSTAGRLIQSKCSQRSMQSRNDHYMMVNSWTLPQ
jgi:hypothetical protein